MNVTEDIIYAAGDPCALVVPADRRWYLVAVIGTMLSMISVISNIVIAIALLTQRRQHYFFLGLLAISDCFLSLCYGPVIALDIIKDEIQILWITRLWWSYIAPMLALCHVSMTFSCFLIILATVERYFVTIKSPLLYDFKKHRRTLTTAMFSFAFIVRGSVFFEIHVMKNGNCTGLTEFQPVLTDIVNTWIYGTIFRFYFRNISTVLVPFFLLAYLNIRIVHTLKQHHRSVSLCRYRTPEFKMTIRSIQLKARSATRLTVLVVCSYLLANFLNVIITAWEFVDFDSTQTEENFAIYETLTDVVSVLFVFTCATRILVYVISSNEIRMELTRTFLRTKLRVKNTEYRFERPKTARFTKLIGGQNDDKSMCNHHSLPIFQVQQSLS